MLQLKPEELRLADAQAQAVAVCGRQFVADNSGALYWPSQSTLVLADLGLWGGHSGSNGAGLPQQVAARRTLVRLAEVIDRYEPARIVVLGGGGVGDGAADLAPDGLEILGILQEDREWIWVRDAADGDVPPRLGGAACTGLEVSGISLRCRPAPGWTTHEIAGAMQPAARFSMYGYAIRRACFVGNGRRLVMPAFGAVAGGTNVLDDAFRPLFPGGGMAVWMLGQDGLYPVATRFLAAD